jgi:hypothetical protein
MSFDICLHFVFVEFFFTPKQEKKINKVIFGIDSSMQSGFQGQNTRSLQKNKNDVKYARENDAYQN